MNEELPSSEIGQAPPPKARSGMRLAVEIAVVVLIIITIAGICAPAVIVSKMKSDRAEAVSNAKQVGLALFKFQEDYGSYPCKATAIEVKNNNPDTTMELGTTTSNDFFRQLIAAGSIDQERPFFARTLNCRKPDNVIVRGKCMEKGEVGFAYLVSHSDCKEKDFPIILTPLVKGKLLFDYDCARKYFDGKVVVLWADSACTIEAVDNDGHVWIKGKDFFDPSQPYWHGIPPKVAWPE